jgi:SlyX protein
MTLDAAKPTNTDPESRLMHVESLLTHMQHDLEQLSQVVWRQQAEIDALTKELNRLDTRVVTLADGPEMREPLEEKPPHY